MRLTRGVMVASLLGLLSFGSQAGVSLDKTRVVFPANSRSVQLTVRNHGNEVYLTQVLVLQENRQPARDFMVTPPLFRLEKNSRNAVKIMRIGGSLPTDRESLRYLLVRNIPRTTTPFAVTDNSASLSIGIASKIKLFYRPSLLTPAVEQSYGLLKASWQDNQVIIDNPTPYYQTFAELRLDGRAVDFLHQAQMIAPFSQVHYPSTQVVHQVQWRLINDYGAATSFYQQTVGRGAG